MKAIRLVWVGLWGFAAMALVAGAASGLYVRLIIVHGHVPPAWLDTRYADFLSPAAALTGGSALVVALVALVLSVVERLLARRRSPVFLASVILFGLATANWLHLSLPPAR
ncbi:MAG: hypothetical protein WD009_09445 [Phycisphaeraceae bacterium]